MWLKSLNLTIIFMGRVSSVNRFAASHPRLVQSDYTTWVSDDVDAIPSSKPVLLHEFYLEMYFAHTANHAISPQLGNSCYMNSILQCILHIKPITQYFLKGEYVKEINKSNPLGSGGRLATAYASFLADVYSSEYSILAPRLLKQTLSCFAPQFNNNYQHDSQEFCQYLMDGLHEDLNRVRTKPYVEEMEALGVKDSKAAMESWKKHLLRHDSIFVDYLQGMHRSHLTCPRCGRESIKFDVFSSISLPLVPAKERSFIPLKDCLDQFAAGEQLDEHNAWYCSACKRHVCALKLITLWNTPDVLIIHLKRFTFEKCPIDGRILRRKIEDKVSFPIDRLDLSSYVLGPKDLDAPPVYKVR